MSEPMLPALGVVLAAFCVWLTVRIINRDRWTIWTTLATVAAFLVLLQVLVQLAQQSREIQ